MDAKELIPMIEDRVLLGAADGAIRKTILRALTLLASMEGSNEEIVRELREEIATARCAWGHEMTLAKKAESAAARIVSDAQEKERLRAELASVRAVVEIAEKFGKPGGDFAATLIITELLEAVAAHRAARPKDAP